MNLSDFGKDVRHVIGAVAPTLGLALGGPFGAAAGTWIANKLGDGDSAKAASAIAAGDPQTLVALQKLNVDFKQHLADLAVSEDQLQQSDRANARDMAIKTGNVYIPAAFAGLFILSWFIIQTTLMWHLVPDMNRDLMSRTLGTLDVALGTIIGYYFGSSVGSNAKTEILRQFAEKNGAGAGESS